MKRFVTVAVLMGVLVACGGSDSELADQFELVKGGVVRLEVATCEAGGIGTGFLIDENHIVTVAHVVDEAQEIIASVDDEIAIAEVVAIDRDRDLALLRTDIPFGSYYFSLGDFDYRTGDQITVIGFPLGLDLSLTVGTISNEEVSFDFLPLLTFMQIDAPANPGNSGGPVLNADGEVIGIIDWQISDTQGLNFAISVDSVDRIFSSWLDNTPISFPACGSGSPTTEAVTPTSRPELISARVTATVNVGETPQAVAFDGSHMWVTNTLDDTVSKINVSTNTVTDTVTVGELPRGVAFDGSHMWVNNTYDGTVSKINVSTNTVTATVNVGGFSNVKAAFDGSHMWVTNSNKNMLSKINVSTNTVTATVNVGVTPQGSAFDGSHMWVANLFDNTVSKINVSTNTVTATVNVGDSPFNVAFDGSHMWVTNAGDGTVSKINVSTNTVTDTVNVGGIPEGLAFDGSHMWVTNTDSNTVSKFVP